MICGVGLVFLVREIVNDTTFPDLLVAPLLTDDSSASADAIVVLGAGVIGDCVPNANGMRRVFRGVDAFRAGRAPMFVITGGKAGGVCPVADAMANVARDLGVPPDKMVVERESTNTHENGERVAPMLRERNVRRILLVTDRLHMRRATGVFAHLGFVVEPFAVPIYEGHADNVSMLGTGIREAVGLLYYRLRGWTGDDGSARQAPAHSAEPSTRRDAVGGDTSDNGGLVVEQGGTRSGPVVILGASYAAGWKLDELGGVPVINAGVSGQQSSEMLARFDRDVVAARPRAVVLWGFINDIFRNDDSARAISGVRESYTEMIKRARAEKIEPILATELTMRAPRSFLEPVMQAAGWLLGKQSYQDQVNGHVMKVNGWIRDIARADGLLVLDLQATLADSSGRRRREFAVDDGSHITSSGYEALTQYARPILVEHLRAKVPSDTRAQ
jgi:uncharacterized SAM-binding protein YcdF (DUF218 family)/lysophospholipase L1-like esterase